MSIWTHVAGLVRLVYTGPNIARDEILKHFNQAVPAGSEGRIEISIKGLGYTNSSIVLEGDLKDFGADKIPLLEAWYSNRLATLKAATIKQAVLSAEVEDPHVFYIWVRGSEPGLKAVAMEGE